MVSFRLSAAWILLRDCRDIKEQNNKRYLTKLEKTSSDIWNMAVKQVVPKFTTLKQKGIGVDTIILCLDCRFRSR